MHLNFKHCVFLLLIFNQCRLNAGRHEKIVRTYYYKGGQHEVYSAIDDTLKNGEYTKFYPNGEIEMHGFYKNGAAVGEWKEYYNNGKLKHLRYYNMTCSDSLDIKYDSTGNVMR